MKFLRQFMAVCVLVAAVIGVGFAWKHSAAASLVADDRADRPSASQSPPPGPDQRDRGPRGNHGLSISNIGDLGQSLAVQGAVVGAVVLIDRKRRQRRRVPVR